MKYMEPGQKIWNDARTVLGTPTGGEHACTLESCSGVRIATRWPNGRLTFPCSKGLVDDNDGNLRIG